MKLKEKAIFKSYLFLTLEEEKDWKKSIIEWLSQEKEERGYTDEDLTEDSQVVDEHFHDDIWDMYDCEKQNLYKTLPNKIIAFGSVGVWNGTFKGGKVLGNNLNDILSCCECDDLSITYDRYDVHGTFAHHDGRHYMTFRMVKEGVDPDRLIEIQAYEGGLTPQQITRYTKSLVPYVKAIYGA